MGLYGVAQRGEAPRQPLQGRVLHAGALQVARRLDEFQATTGGDQAQGVQQRVRVTGAASVDARRQVCGRMVQAAQRKLAGPQQMAIGQFCRQSGDARDTGCYPAPAGQFHTQRLHRFGV